MKNKFKMCYLSYIMFQWRTIPGFSKYEVSTYGHIRHKKRKKILKGSIDKDGYRMVKMKNNEGKKKRVRVGRMTGLTFCHNDDPKNKIHIDHINRKKNDDRISNLRWVTPSQNQNNRNTPKTYKMRKDNKSGVIYIYPIKNKWGVKYKGEYIGIYENIEEAKKELEKLKCNYNI